MKFSACITTIIATLATSVQCHSWVQSLEVIGPIQNVSRALRDPTTPHPGLGYIRAYPARVDALASNTILFPDTAFACMPQQRTQTQDAAFVRLKASPGDIVQGNYTENGHVSLPAVTQLSSGTVYWYGTSQPKVDEKLADVMEWTSDCTGGDGRGCLLSTAPFDDGTCIEKFNDPAGRTPEGILRHQQSPDGLPCASTFTIPKNVKVDSLYTVYWAWDYSEHLGPENPDPKVAKEWYSSCMDIEVVARASQRRLVRSAKFRL
ncbi:hypothetical protein DFP73DRAFT_628976 [Morchella snyderi]|nr:hypothetical protein DFP73DRAFT_628976 [Morchella snyderi]